MRVTGASKQVIRPLDQIENKRMKIEQYRRVPTRYVHCPLCQSWHDNLPFALIMMTPFAVRCHHNQCHRLTRLSPLANCHNFHISTYQMHWTGTQGTLWTVEPQLQSFGKPTVCIIYFYIYVFARITMCFVCCKYDLISAVVCPEIQLLTFEWKQWST